MRAKIEAVLQAYREEAATEEQMISEILMILAIGGVARRRMVSEMVQTVSRYAPATTAGLHEDVNEDTYRKTFDDIARFDFNGGLKQ